MWKRFVYMYEALKYKEYYYAAHYKRASMISLICSVVVMFVSAASMLVWSVSKVTPTLWALLIAAAQFVQFLIPQFPWAKQAEALKYLLPELKKLSLKVDKAFMKIRLNPDVSDGEICELISRYETTFANLENQFVQDIVFPERKSVIIKAEKDKNSYFFAKYPETIPEKGG